MDGGWSGRLVADVDGRGQGVCMVVCRGGWCGVGPDGWEQCLVEREEEAAEKRRRRRRRCEV